MRRKMRKRKFAFEHRNQWEAMLSIEVNGETYSNDTSADYRLVFMKSSHSQAGHHASPSASG